MMSKARIIAAAVLGTLLALTSCRDLSLDPVFFALENEQVLAEDRGFEDTASVFRMVKIKVTTLEPADYYYYLAAANTLYIRAIGGAGNNWKVVAPPASLANPLCNSVAVFDAGSGDDIYVGFYNSATGVGYGLWRGHSEPTTIDPDHPELPPNITWQAVADTDVQDLEIVMIRAAGGQLFVSTRSGNANALLYGNGSTFDPVSWATAPQADISITDVEQYSGNYWVIVGPSLYQSTGPLPGSFAVYSGGTNAPVSPLSGALTFGGLFVDGITLYVSAHDGRLYSTADGGGNWATTPSPILYNDDPDTPVGFTAFALPASDYDYDPLDPLKKRVAVYVGTQSYGYYRIPPGGDVTATLTREPSFNIPALYNGAVNSFYYDGTFSRLFLCTSGAGLWRGENWNGSDWTWKQE